MFEFVTTYILKHQLTVFILDLPNLGWVQTIPYNWIIGSYSQNRNYLRDNLKVMLH